MTRFRTIVADPPWRYTKDPGSLRARRQEPPRGRGRQGHSEKPDLFYDLVEQVSPEPRLELFARRARFGWDYYGDESLGTVSLPAMEADPEASDTQTAPVLTIGTTVRNVPHDLQQ